MEKHHQRMQASREFFEGRQVVIQHLPTSPPGGCKRGGDRFSSGSRSESGNIVSHKDGSTHFEAATPEGDEQIAENRNSFGSNGSSGSDARSVESIDHILQLPMQMELSQSTKKSHGESRPNSKLSPISIREHARNELKKKITNKFGRLKKCNQNIWRAEKM